MTSHRSEQAPDPSGVTFAQTYDTLEFGAAVAAAAQRQGLVVLYTNWRQEAGSLATVARLTLGLTTSSRAFPLNASWSVVPFTSVDRLEVHAPIYDPDAVANARRAARIERRRTPVHRLDMVEADWELAYRRKRDRLLGSRFPLSSFVPVDRVGRGGRVEEAHPSMLGVRRARSELRNPVLVPSHGAVDDAMAILLAESEYVLVDLRSLRAPSAFEMALRVARRRRDSQTTILVARTPWEAIRFLDTLGRTPTVALSSGDPTTFRDASIRLVNRDRLHSEQDFESAVAPLTALGETVRPIIVAARRAWWEAHQLLSDEVVRPDLQELTRLLEDHRRTAPEQARLFNAALGCITRATTVSASDERMDTVLAATESALNAGPALILTRNGSQADHLVMGIARSWQCRPEEIGSVGARVLPCFASLADGTHARTLLLTGLFGVRSIDAIFASRIPDVVLVLDPIEARVARLLAEKAIRFLHAVGLPSSAGPLEDLRTALVPHVVPGAEAVDIDVDGMIAAPLTARISISPTGGTRSDGTHARVQIELTDGAVIDAPADRRFDAIDPEHLVIKRLRAADLRPGSSIVVVRGDYQRTLSDLLLEVLDDGPLKQFARSRETWLVLVAAAAADLSINEVVRRMHAFGFPVDRQTVRLWVMRDQDLLSKKNCPRSLQEFRAFGHALDLAVDDATLDRYYDAIRRWRIGHRLVGRQLVRAIGAATLGRLDVSTRERIQREWGGLDLDDLIEGSTLATVEAITMEDA